MDVSDPTNPRLVGSYDTPGRASGVVVSGDYAYVADGHEGLLVLDVSDPADIREVGRLETSDPVNDVFLSGGYLFLFEGRGTARPGISVIDISDPANPRRIGYIGVPGSVWRGFVSDGYVFGLGEDGLTVLGMVESEVQVPQLLSRGESLAVSFRLRNLTSLDLEGKVDWTATATGVGVVTAESPILIPALGETEATVEGSLPADAEYSVLWRLFIRGALVDQDAEWVRYAISDIRGRVRLEGLDNFEGVRVIATDAEGTVRSLWVNLSTGDFSYSWAPEGWFTLEADRVFYLPAQVEVYAPAGEIDVGELVLRAGDVNNDDRVDTADLEEMVDRLGEEVLGPLYGPDYNGDGVLDLRDLVMVARNFGAR